LENPCGGLPHDPHRSGYDGVVLPLFHSRYPDPRTTGAYHDNHPHTAAAAGLRGLLLSRLNRLHWPAFIPAFTIWSLVRKPGAFAQYRYRDDLFPSLVFRRAYDALQASATERADRHYVRLLHLAASTSESEVETAIGLLLEQHVVPTFDTVRDLLRPPAAQRVPELSAPVLDLSVYDQLLGREVAHA